MPVPEKYICEHDEPRLCEDFHSSMGLGSGRRPPAVVIFHDRQGKEHFLCKDHAAERLAEDRNRKLLAMTILDIYCPDRTEYQHGGWQTKDQFRVLTRAYLLRKLRLVRFVRL